MVVFWLETTESQSILSLTLTYPAITSKPAAMIWQLRANQEGGPQALVCSVPADGDLDPRSHSLTLPEFPKGSGAHQHSD